MKITKSNITKYLGYLVIMSLVALATSGVGHIGIYIALIFGGESACVLSILLVLAGMVARPELYTLLAMIAPIIVMLSTRLILRRIKKRMSMLLATILGALSLLPILVMGVLESDNVINAITGTISSAIFTYISIVASFAVVVKKLRVELSRDEKVALLVILGVVAKGIYHIDILGFRVYYIFVMLIVLILPLVTNLAPSLLISLSFGIGGGISGLNLELSAIIVMMMSASYLFMRYKKIYSIIAVIAIDLLGGLYFNVYESYDYLHLIAVAVGVLIFVLIPNRYYRYYASIYKDKGRGNAISAYIHRNRIDINARLNNLALIFSDIEAELTKGEYVLSRPGWRKAISESIMCSICSSCKDRDVCYRALGGDTLSQIEPIVDRAFADKASPDDVGTFLASRCNRILDMVDMANTQAVKYPQTSTHIYDVLDNKRLLGEQLGAVGVLINKLSSSILVGVHSNEDMESRIAEELGVVGVIVSDVLVMESKDGSMDITLTLRRVDKDKRIVRTTLERLMGISLDKAEDRVCEIEGFTTLRFFPRARYTLIYGVASQRKDGSKASGDTNTALKISRSKVAIGICDGKGSGSRAGANSQNTINIVENMYKAGFESEMVLDFANRLLSIRNSEDFSALDMCIFDLDSANVDFIKLGGVTSYIKRNDSVDTVEGSALPIGVLDEAEPSTVRRSLANGDVVIMLSDGVTDVIDDDMMRDILINMSTANVQTIADTILLHATENGAHDDCTAIAVRVAKV